VAHIYPIDRAYKVTTLDHGNIGEFGLPTGSGGATSCVGTYLVQIVPSVDFAGSFGVVGRAQGLGIPSDTESVPFVQIPYRQIYVAGAPVSYTFSTAVLTDACLIQVPANGVSLGLLFSCTAGHAWVYTRQLDGSSAV